VFAGNDQATTDVYAYDHQQVNVFFY